MRIQDLGFLFPRGQRKVGAGFLLCAVLLAGFVGRSEEPATEPVEFYPLAEVRPGLRGTGLTTFHADQIEEFEVEILGVLENFAPRRNMILARVSGGPLEETGIVAGMSGSPIYIEGKLLGALAFGFPFSTEPIGGITPIEDIVAVVPERAEAESRKTFRAPPVDIVRVANLSGSEAADVRWIPPDQSEGNLFARFQGPATADSGLPVGLRIPLIFSGFDPSWVEPLKSQWRSWGFEPLMGVGNLRWSEQNGSEPPLPQPGSMISMQLVRGDLNIKADCTVTYRVGNQIYACGHGFLQSGGTQVPFSASKVITVVPSVFSSFKLSAAGPSVGTIRQDRSGGIQGVLGERARMIPVHMELSSTLHREREYNLEVVQDPFLSPLLLNQALMVAITATERRLGVSTLELQGRIRLGGDQSVEFEDIVSGEVNSHVAAAAAVAAPLRILLSSGYPDLTVEGVDLSVVSTAEKRLANLEQVWSSKSVVQPGEEIVIHGMLRTPGGKTLTQKIPLVVPESVAGKFLSITVGDGGTINRLYSRRVFPHRGRPAKDLRQLVRALNRLRRNNRLYVLLLAPKRTFVIQGEEFPSPPPSLIQTLLSDPAVSTNMATSGQSIIGDSEGSPLPYAIQGRRTLRLQVSDSPGG